MGPCTHEHVMVKGFNAYCFTCFLFSFFNLSLSLPLCLSLSRYMVTTGFDAKIRVWDVRQYKPVNCFPILSLLLHHLISVKEDYSSVWLFNLVR